MKNYVVAALSFFENDIKQFKIEAESEYDAVKKALVDFASQEYRQDEIDFQNSEEYPQTLEDLQDYCMDGDIVINILEI